MLPIFAIVVALVAARAAEAQKPPRVVELTVGDNMKFSSETIEAKPGESITVQLKSTGTMPKVAMGHNFVLLKATAAPLEFANAGMEHRDTDFIAPQMKDQILASTKLIGPGESADVTFKAPTKPGSYTYLCSFPGHFTGGMKGTLVVK
jgi:azurin